MEVDGSEGGIRVGEGGCKEKRRERSFASPSLPSDYRILLLRIWRRQKEGKRREIDRKTAGTSNEKEE